MATVSPCNECGTMMFTFGTCPNCGAQKRSDAQRQVAKTGGIVVALFLLLIFVPLVFLMVAGIGLELLRSLLH